MNLNYKEGKSWPALLALLLLLPSHYYVLGLNIIYIYPCLLLALFVVCNSGRIPLPKKTGNNLFIVYLFYLAIIAVLQRGILYGIATAASTLGVLYLVIAISSSKSRILKLIRCISVITFICCILGIFEGITSVNIFQLLSNSGLSFFTEFRMGHIRIMAQFAQPIVYGYFLILVSPLIIYAIVQYRESSKVRLYKLTYILMWVNVLLTASRAVMICFLLLQLIYLYKIGHTKFAIWSFFGMVVLFAIFLMDQFVGFRFMDTLEAYFSMFSAIFGGESTDVYTGVGNRFEIMSWVIETVGDDFWFGKGIDSTFSYVVHAWQIKESIENEYLNTYFHYGLVGVVLQVITFIKTLLFGFKLAKKSNEEDSFNLIWAISMCLLVFYVVLLTAGQSSAVTMHIFLIGILMASFRLYSCAER